MLLLFLCVLWVLPTPREIISHHDNAYLTVWAYANSKSSVMPSMLKQLQKHGGKHRCELETHVVGIT